MNDVHCHHKIPWHMSKDDSYENLIILNKEIHELIHLKDMEAILNKIAHLKLSEAELEKINILREMSNQSPISVSLLGSYATEAIQLCLF